MTIDKQDEYEVVFPPDKAVLRELIQRAKGTKRTMAQYAEACETSASTLSRITTGKISKTISVDFIKRLYEAQDPEANISFDTWMQANGMRKKTLMAREYSPYINMQSFQENRDRESCMKQTVTNELIDREVIFQKKNRRIIGEDQNGRRPLARGTQLSLFLPDDGYYWDFIFFMTRFEGDVYNKVRKYFFRHIFEPWSTLFLMDAWYPEMMKDDKISFVFVDENVMNGFMELISADKLHNKFSFILMDREGKSVLKEVDPYGVEEMDSLFLRKVVIEDDDDWGGKDFGHFLNFDE